MRPVEILPIHGLKAVPKLALTKPIVGVEAEVILFVLRLYVILPPNPTDHSFVYPPADPISLKVL